jgi:hypothetical protein
MDLWIVARLGNRTLAATLAAIAPTLRRAPLHCASTTQARYSTR